MLSLENALESHAKCYISHFFPVAGCSKSCEAAQYWSSGFTVLQASIDAAIIQVNVIKEEK